MTPLPKTKTAKGELACRRALAVGAMALILFLSHRQLALPSLRGGLDVTGMAGFRVWLVGFCSDVWVAFLLSFVVLISHGVPLLGGVVSGLVVFGTGCSVLLHQRYVEYFRHQLLPYHLSYLGDIEFIRSSTGAFWSGEIPLLFLWLALALGAGFLVYRLRGSKLSFRVIYGVFFMAALWLHNRNIYLRVQWFIPSELQVHFYERAYYHLRENPLPDPLSRRELQFLAEKFGREATNSALLTKAVQAAFEESPLKEEYGQLKRIMDQRRQEGRGPLGMVVLMEGLRFSDTGLKEPVRKSITPRLDALRSHGILFENAYSTGTVTRGGQEAVFCGYLSSATHSMMRNRVDLNFPCLSEIWSGEVFWYHGGQGAFDNQERFWQSRGIADLMTAKDFPSYTAKSDWGYSDLSLFQNSLAKLTQWAEGPRHPRLGMILTVTNHIPWMLPKDAPYFIWKRAKLFPKRNYQTTLYTDYALGEFVDGLKERGLWEDTLLFIVSDHGVSGQPYQEDVVSSIDTAYLKTHIVLLMTGGVVEQAGLQGVTVKDYVSQADIAPTLNALFSGPKVPFMGENLFVAKRKRAVISDLGADVLLPESGYILSQKQQRAGSLQLYLENRKAWESLVYRRAFLHFLNGEGKKPSNFVNAKKKSGVSF